MFDFKSIEERILKFWEEHDVFRKSMDARKGQKPLVVFEGPPFANGNPGIHHFIGRVFKDLFNRYQTMRGRFVLRKGGWDTHGLPVELGVEKELGFKSKRDIEAYGVGAYNKKCRESVWKYKKEWDEFTRRIGYWVDLKDPYITYDNSYIESLWNIISQFHQHGLLYQAHRVGPFCTRCGTTLSSHELAQGYKRITDTSVMLKFKVKSTKLKVPKETFILVWTTTPWTLPGNVALAVGQNVRYALAKTDHGEHLIIAIDRLADVLGESAEIEREFAGADIVGTSYEPLFDVKALKKSAAYKVHAADFVTTNDGTGVVHIAPMYGEDDYRLGAQEKLPLVHTVDERGNFTGVSKDLDGKYVKNAETEELILQKLETDNLILKTVPYEHEYPFCWRCWTPLLYYAKDSWFVRMSALNKELLANNDTIAWVPAHLKEGRFGQWLREGKDWNFSRERYWGTPLPVWRSKDKKETLVVSSLADLDTYRADTPATFWVVRHGESQKNVDHTNNSGGAPSPLTEAGRAQAIAAAEALRGKKFAAIIASPVNRAHETAEIIAQELGIKKIITDERLGEIRFGPSLEGKSEQSYHDAFPTFEQKFAQRPVGGESLTDVRERVWNALRECNERYAGKDVLLVSHEYPIWMMTDAANGWSVEQSIHEKDERVSDFVTYGEPMRLVVRNLPRDEHGNLDMHRPYVDDIILKKDGALLYRVPEIVDVWFDSGAMPFAQWHYPFENAELFKQQFPADFICEGIDQTRGWFYTLLSVSTALGMGAPYRSVLSYGHVLDEKGQKMSKSKGNIVRPDDVISAVGVDAARWYFYTINSPEDPKLFSMKEVRERLTGFMGTLENCVRFYELYQQEHLEPQTSNPEPSHLLDRWIFSRLNEVAGLTMQRLEQYDPTTAARALEQFVVDDFSQWWLRRSRKRDDAIPLLKHLLRSLALLLAPFIPFTAEDLWQKVKREGDALSVHLADWPSVDGVVDAVLHEQMARVREDISAGLAIRKEQQIKVRQPLQSVTVPGDKLHPDLEQLIRDELNVKEVRYAPGKPVELDLNIGRELRAEGFARETMRAIQDMRKEANCRVSDKVHCQWSTDDAEISNALTVHAEMIARDTGLSAFVQQADMTGMTIEKQFNLAPGASVHLGLRLP